VKRKIQLAVHFQSNPIFIVKYSQNATGTMWNKILQNEIALRYMRNGDAYQQVSLYNDLTISN